MNDINNKENEAPNNQYESVVKNKYKRYQYSTETFIAAYKAVENGASIRSASKQFNVPYMTLHRKTKNNCSGK